MQTIVVILVAFVREIVLSRARLQLENIALRQQLAVLKRDRPRPQLHPLDRVFWVLVSRLWPWGRKVRQFLPAHTSFAEIRSLQLATSRHGRGSSKPNQAHTNYTP